MSHRGATSSQALASLERMSQSGTVTLTVLAQPLVDEPGLRRARAGHY
jgi:hypothetical protein